MESLRDCFADSISRQGDRKAITFLREGNVETKAIKWKKMLAEGEVGSLSEIAKKEGLTRARVTQIMHLLKLLAEMQEFLISPTIRRPCPGFLYIVILCPLRWRRR